MSRADSIFSAPGPRIYSIDAGRPFLDDLADGVIEALGADPVAVASARIYLPTRRAARAAALAFAGAFVRRGRAAALTPRCLAFGDIEEDEATGVGGLDAETELAPAISAFERRFVFTQMIAAADRAHFDGQANWAAAYGAAGELGALLDAFHAEEVSPLRLKSLDVGPHAAHWTRSLEFLTIALERWPDYLAASGRMDMSARRAALISAEARRLAHDAPRSPVILAGTTASAPAVQRLARTIASLPAGCVVLPGLDRGIDDAARGAIDDAHPQAGLIGLLDALGVAIGAVRAFPGGGAPSPRAAMLSIALRPAAATDDWPALAQAWRARGADDIARDLALVEAETEHAEASAIAMMLRETIETPEATAMLVTPDRMLARRVALIMRRWGVEIEDSAGAPLAGAPCGVFLRLVADWMEAPGDAARLVALLRHPLAGLGLDDATRARAAGAVDRALRGPASEDGFAFIARQCAGAPHAAPAIEALAAALAQPGADDLAGAAARLARAAEMLAATDAQAGAERLWRGADGEAAARLIADFAGLGDSGVREAPFAALFAAAAASQPVRLHSGAHPRVAILGPLEARLLSADHVVLGGLNEGVWPGEPGGDGFLSRPMRRALGLFSPERRIGLSAHDFNQLAAQPRVSLTRARRVDGQPAGPSRWIIRIKNILGEAACRAIDRTARYAAFEAAFAGAADYAPTQPPRPRPGAGARPARLPVTDIEKLARDPYAVYARRVLGLARLDDPGRAFSGADLGGALHAVFERAAKSAATALPDIAALRALFDEEARARGMSAVDRRLWASAIDDALAWFAAFERRARAEGAHVYAEIEGAADLAGLAAPFTLTARADRIEIAASGEASVVDFKLSGGPTKKQAEAFSPQLELISWIVQQGGFKTIGAARVARYAYERIVGRDDDDARTTLETAGAEAQDRIGKAADGLRRLIAHYDSDVPYLSQPRPEFASTFAEYDQLARRREWALGEEADP